MGVMVDVAACKQCTRLADREHSTCSKHFSRVLMTHVTSDNGDAQPGLD